MKLAPVDVKHLRYRKPFSYWPEVFACAVIGAAIVICDWISK